MRARDKLTASPLLDHVAAVSCGLYRGVAVADLDYEEDSQADADANFVMTGRGGICEIQGTAETDPFSQAQFLDLMSLAKKSIDALISLQRQAVS